MDSVSLCLLSWKDRGQAFLHLRKGRWDAVQFRKIKVNTCVHQSTARRIVTHAVLQFTKQLPMKYYPIYHPIPCYTNGVINGVINI